MIVLEIFQKDTGYIIQKKFCTCTQILSLIWKKIVLLLLWHKLQIENYSQKYLNWEITSVRRYQWKLMYVIAEIM